MKKSITTNSPELSPGDLRESGAMLYSTATLLRQAFGIVCMFNDLTPSPMSESELKTFAQHFDVVHKTCGTFSRSLFDYAGKIQSDATKS